MEPNLLLQRELTRRCQANPSYSLRAFAKAIGLSASTVSMVLAGKRRLSPVTKKKIAGRLGLSAEDTHVFLDGDKPPATAKRPRDHRLVALDSFAVIADWYHLAILSLLELEKLELEPRLIARYLGIHEQEAKAALERLQRLDLIEQVRGRWKQKGAELAFDNTVSSAASVRFNRQILERAIQSIENDPFEARIASASTFEMSSRQVAIARSELKTWRREFSEKLRTSGRADQVYCLAVQLFPLSRKMETKKKENK